MSFIHKSGNGPTVRVVFELLKDILEVNFDSLPPVFSTQSWFHTKPNLLPWNWIIGCIFCEKGYLPYLSPLSLVPLNIP